MIYIYTYQLTFASFAAGWKTFVGGSCGIQQPNESSPSALRYPRIPPRGAVYHSVLCNSTSFIGVTTHSFPMSLCKQKTAYMSYSCFNIVVYFGRSNELKSKHSKNRNNLWNRLLSSSVHSDVWQLALLWEFSALLVGFLNFAFFVPESASSWTGLALGRLLFLVDALWWATDKSFDEALRVWYSERLHWSVVLLRKCSNERLNTALFDKISSSQTISLTAVVVLFCFAADCLLQLCLDAWS